MSFKENRRNMIVRAIKEGYPAGYANLRYTGTSTGIALRLIGEAMVNPGHPIPIRDHVRLDSANKRLANIIRSIIAKLELEGLEVNGLTLVYSLEHVDKSV